MVLMKLQCTKWLKIYINAQNLDLDIYILKADMDISCLNLEDECNLEGFCVPFGPRVRECTFLEIYICIGYMLPTVWGIYVS